MSGDDADPITLRAFQEAIERLYGSRDTARGTDGTFVWFVEEVGELARAIRRPDRRNLEEEFADVLAWLSTLASLKGVDMDEVARRYMTAGCPHCRQTPCSCPLREDRA